MAYALPEKPDMTGDWAAMRDLAKLKEVLRVKKGFLQSDDANSYQGENKPRWIVASTVVSSGDEIKTGVSKGYTRDIDLQDMAEHLDGSPDGAFIDFKFVVVKSPYIGIELVDSEGVA
jgi:hypothetical protein